MKEYGYPVPVVDMGKERVEPELLGIVEVGTGWTKVPFNKSCFGDFGESLEMRVVSVLLC